MASVKSESLLKPEQIDTLGLAILSLARELWVVKDRQMVLEAFLEQKGLIAELSTHQPDAELSAALAKERDRFAAAIAQVLLVKDPET